MLGDEASNHLQEGRNRSVKKEKYGEENQKRGRFGCHFKFSPTNITTTILHFQCLDLLPLTHLLLDCLRFCLRFLQQQTTIFFVTKPIVRGSDAIVQLIPSLLRNLLLTSTNHSHIFRLLLQQQLHFGQVLLPLHSIYSLCLRCKHHLYVLLPPINNAEPGSSSPVF